MEDPTREERERKKTSASSGEERRLAVLAVRECSDPALLPDRIWRVIELYAGTLFYTARMLPFTYYVRGGELFCDRKEKSITRVSVLRAYDKITSALGTGSPVRGPKELNMFGAPYLWAILKETGLCPTERMGVYRPRLGLNREQLRASCECYHFGQDSLRLLYEVYLQLERELDPVVWYCLRTETDRPPRAGVVVTLGGRVDQLQERLADQELLTEGYMTECLSWELLRLGYAAVSGELLGKYGLYSARLLFPGDQIPLTMLQQICRAAGARDIRLDPSGILHPKYSCGYLLLLSEQETECAGLCTGCGKKDCEYAAFGR